MISMLYLHRKGTIETGQYQKIGLFQETSIKRRTCHSRQQALKMFKMVPKASSSAMMWPIDL